MNKNYYRVMLGRKSIFAKEYFEKGLIGASWLPNNNLEGKLPDDWRPFNKEYIPIYLRENPEAPKVAAGLACGMLWTVAKGILVGDVVLCPDGEGNYYVGEVTSEYEYQKGTELPHVRKIAWYPKTILRSEMSEALRNSTGSVGTVSNITKHSVEIESLLKGNAFQQITTNDETIEDPSTFALEKHLEDFLIQNWHHTLLGKKYNIYEVDGEIVGQQYPSDTGPIDILAISKDGKEILVVELKKGRISDVVVGQIQRYMGFVQSDLAEKGQIVRGVIISLEDDLKLRRALSVTNNIEFYTYKIHFELKDMDVKKA